MNVKATRTKKQVNVENQAIKLLSKEELGIKIEVIKKELRSYTWRDLETNGKFAKNDKLSFITDDMLIAGCDIGFRRLCECQGMDAGTCGKKR